MRTVLMSSDAEDIKNHNENSNYRDAMARCDICSDLEERRWIREKLISDEIIENPFGNNKPPYLIIMKFKCNSGINSYEGDGDNNGKLLIAEYFKSLGRKIKSFTNVAHYTSAGATYIINA